MQAVCLFLFLLPHLDVSVRVWFVIAETLHCRMSHSFWSLQEEIMLGVGGMGGMGEVLKKLIRTATLQH